MHQKSRKASRFRDSKQEIRTTMATVQGKSDSNDKHMDDACVEVMLPQDMISPLSPWVQEKASVNVSPVSPTSTADVFLILDEGLVGGKLSMRSAPEQSYLNKSVYVINEDDNISLCCSEDDEMEEEEDLFGLTFLMEEDLESQSSMEE